MKKLSEFVTKNKMKIGMLLLCFIVLIVACICYVNNNKQIATLIEPEEEKVKAQLDTAPEGYTAITTKEQLSTIKDNLSGNYILMADLDMTGVAFEPIGTNSAPFKGTFDGNYHKITNLKIESSNQYVGMFGYINGGTVENILLENVDISGSKYVAGLAGWISGTISNVGVTGKITGTSYVAGIAGDNRATITNAYSIVTITGTERYIGGLVGDINGGRITNTYAVGKVTAKGASNVGGLTGYKGTVTNSYWAIDTTGQATSPAGEGKFFSAMLKQNTFTNWDFDNVWQIEEGATLPYLRGMTKPGVVNKTNYTYIKWEGEGTEESPYLVKTPEQLNAINYSLSAHYKLANDINMQDKTFEIIGQTTALAFTGTFDGNGHKISNLKIESSNQYIGMFGYISGGTVENLILENINVKGTSTHIGGLVGSNYNGTITNVGVTGEVRGTDYVGGLAGYSRGNITNAYSTATVTATGNRIGGLVGESRGKITNTYAVGEVTGTGSNVGGLIGYQYGGTTTDSYWSIDQSKQSTSGGGEGKFLSAMLKQSTFKNWGFDTVWQIEEGSTLPYLQGMAKPEMVKKENYTYTEWEGEGTESNPYLIKTPQNLREIHNLPSAHYQLANDIDMQNEEYQIILPASKLYISFTGTFDGANHKISNLKIESDNQYVGMFGYIDGGTIKNLGLENVNVTYKGNNSNSYTGGLVGYLNRGEITNTYVTGQVNGQSNVGGIAGCLWKGSINNSYSSANVTGTSDVGGIIGYNNSSNASIINSYSTGEVYGTSYVGGIAGRSSVTITNTYAVGKVTATTTTAIGGLVGSNNGTVTNSYYSTNTTEQSTSAAGEGKFFSAMLKKDTYKNWKFDTVWKIEEGTTLPYLIGMEKPETVKKENYEYRNGGIGEGSIDDPILIRTPEDLRKVNNYLHLYHQLANDIDMQNEEYEIISPTETSAFTGTFDGNGYKISNLKIESNNQYVGMFGYIDGGTIKNLELENIKIAKNGNNMSYIGGIAGRINNATIENSHTKVEIINNMEISNCYIGGLIGEVYDSKISKCYTDNEIKIDSGSGHIIGGLIGSSTANKDKEVIVEKSYTKGRIKVTSNGNVTIGGMIGRNDANTKINNVYSILNIYSSSETGQIGGITGYSDWMSVSGLVYYVGKIEVDSESIATGGIVGNLTKPWCLPYNTTYYSDQSTKRDVGIGTTKKTMKEMLTKETYPNKIFDTDWDIKENGKSLPYLRDLPMQDELLEENIKYFPYEENAEDSGSKDNPIIITTAKQLENLNSIINKKYFVLGNDIDLSSIDNFSKIIGDFRGELDGNGHSINNITIKSDSEYVGLFERNEGVIRNLKLNNVKIESTYNGETAYVGGLVGYNKGIIENVEIDGTVKSTGNVINLNIDQIAGYSEKNLSVNFLKEGDYIKYDTGVKSVGDNGIVTFRVLYDRTSGYGIQIISNDEIAKFALGDDKNYSKSVNDYNNAISILNTEANKYLNKKYAKSARCVGSVPNNPSKENNEMQEIDSKYYPYATSVNRTGKSQDYNYIMDDQQLDVVNIKYIGKPYWLGSRIDSARGANLVGFRLRDIAATASMYENHYIYGIYSNETINGNTTFSNKVDLGFRPCITLNNDLLLINGDGASEETAYTLVALSEYQVEHYKQNLETNSYDLTETNKLTGATGDIATAIAKDYIGFKENTTHENRIPTGEILEDGSLVLKLYYDRIVQDITIESREEGTTIPVANAVIGLFNKNGEALINKQGEQIITTTRENGKVIFEKLEPGIYKYKQLSVPTGYILNNTMYTFTIAEEGNVIFEEAEKGIIYNKKIRMAEKDSFVVTKYRTGTDTVVSGAVIGIFDAEGKEISRQTTGENGTITISGLEVGEYYYKEIQAPAGYVLNSTEYHFTVNNDGTVTLAEGVDRIIYNDRVRMGDKDSFVVTKYRTGTDIAVPGAVIGIFDSEGNEIKEISRQTTGESGTITISGLEVGDYYYKEITAPAGYVLNNTEYHFTVENDGSVTLAEETNKVIYNDRVTMNDSLVITKYRTNTTTPLAGATIAVFNEAGEKVAEKVTGENGQVTFTGLEVGNYYYQEISAPAGYVLNNTEYHFTVENDGSVTLTDNVDRIIYNDRVTMGDKDSFVVTKYRTGTDIALSGAVIGIFDAEDKEISRQTTGESGTITISGLEVGEYYYKEIQAPAGYVLNNAEYHFTVGNDGSVTLAEGVNKVIYNDRVRMGDKDSFVVTKYRTGTDIALSGAVIGIFDAEGKEISRQTTGESGTITISGLEVGEYYYKEITAPAGYVLNNTEYHFTVNNDGTVTLAEGVDRIIYNDRVRMGDKDSFVVTKYRTGTDIVIPGAVIGIFDSEGNEITRLTTGESGTITISGLEVGSYYYKEISAPAGYVLNSIEYHFTVNNDGSVSFAEGTTKVIYNDRVRMTEGLTIIKYRTNTTIPLAGATIAVFDVDGNKVAEKVTGENGQVTFTGLEVGSYYYKEISAPAGYVLNNTEYHFTVNNDGSVSFAQGTTKIIYNDRVRMSDEDNFTVTKMRTGTDIILSGAVIGIFDVDGNEVTRLTTGESGTITISGLEVGSYYYKEISAPAGYVLNDTEYHFTVENDGTVTLTEGVNRIIYNDRVTMGDKDSFVVTKYRTGTDIALSGAVIGIFDVDGNEITRATTGESGTITISGLEVGSYYYKEISAPAGYVLNDAEYHFTVENDGSVKLGEGVNRIIYNDRVRMSNEDNFTVTKMRTGTDTVVSGAVIGIFDAEGKEISRQTTGESGTITISGLEVGSYYYKEINAPAGYVLNNTEYHFTVENDGSVTLTDNVDRIIYNDRVTMGDKDSFVVTKYRTGTDIALSGAVIGIFDAEGNEITRATTGESGTITISGLEVGNYYYKEISAPAGYVLNNTEYHFTVENDGTVTLAEGVDRIIYNDRVRMGDKDSFVVTKYRTGTDIALSGAVIGIFDAEGKEITRATTGESGTITISGLEVGNYYYKEISAPAGYVLNNTEYHFTVENDGSVTLADGVNRIIYNDRVTMTEGLTITKYRTNTETPLAGATIAVFNEAGEKVAEKVTGENGKVTFTGLEVGSYYYKEISAPAGYVLNNTEYHFTVNNNGTVTLAEGTTRIIYNDRVRMAEKDNFTVTKMRTGTDIVIPGAVIGIFDAEGNEVTRATTGESGTVTISGLEVGSYYYKEISAPAGYVLNNTEYHFTVNDNGTVTLADGVNRIIYNDRVRMGDKDSFVVTKYRTGTDIALSGAVIGIFDSEDKEISRQTTGENGTITISGLEVGSYYYKEISAPEGYVLNDTEYHFTVNDNGTVTLAEGVDRIIYNDRVRMSDEDNFTVTKMRTGTDIVVPGAVIGIFDAEGNEVTRATTGESGTITISGLEVGSYYYKEISAPAGYVLNNTEYHFTVENDGSVTLTDNVERIIYNDRVRMGDKDSFVVTKYRTGTDIAVPGAVIGIFDAEGNEIKEISRQITGENGTITISGLEVGEYYYKEITAPAGYVLNNTEYHFTVNNDGSVRFADGVNRIIYNDRVTMTEGLTITKYRTNTTTPLAGATIAVFDVDGNKVAEKVTGENGQVTFTGLEVGSYYYKEISAPAGYVLNNTEYHFTVNNDGSVLFDEGTTKVIYNDRVRMSDEDNFTVTKMRTGTDIALSGAVIGIFDAEGNKISEQTTNESGTITISGLEVGSYYYKEISAPAGYVLNNIEYHFTVNNDGSVTFGEGANKVIYNDRVIMGDKDSFVVTKYRAGTDTVVSGAVIGIFDAEGNEITRLTTGENGTITISGLEVGSYYYKEISAPAGYVLNSAEYHFTVNNDGSVTLAEGVNRIIYNDRVTMSGEDNFTVTKMRTGTNIVLSGAVIGIFDAEGKEVTRATTGESGTITISGLEVGSYYYKEISAPAGYVLNNTEYHFTVNNDGTVTFAENTNRVIYNDRKLVYGDVTITKYITGTTTPLSGAVIAIYKEDGTPMLDKEGNPVKIATSELGTITFKITPGTYMYKEISAPTGYKLNDTTYSFTVSEDGIVTFDSANGIIYNDREIVYGDVTIRKYITNTETPLAGAVIGIYRTDGTPMTDKEGNPVQITTSADGTIKFKITPGTYMYKEITAPTGYVLDNTEHTFTVSEEGIVTFDSANGIIYNTRVTMSEGFVITKYKTGTDTVVSGAVIGLFDETGKELARGTTNERGQVTFTGLEIGTYYYKEISAPAGYILNNTEYHFTVEKDGSVTLAEGTTKVIYNDRVKAAHTIITKYITDSTIPLAGAVIGLFDETGNKLAEQTTNEAGQVDFAGLEPGTYKYKELTAPDGYVLNDTMYTFTIKDDGTVTFDSANGIIYDSRIKMEEDLIIVKYRTNTQIPLAGAVIGLFDERGKEIERQTTDERGQVTFTGLEVGNYYYKEISAPTGYVLNNTEYYFTVENDGSVTLAKDSTKVIYNDRVTVDHVIITKYAEGTKIPVAGAVIGLFDANGNKLAEQTTNASGQVDFAGLEPGTYNYKELTAPNGYILNDTIYTFNIAEDGTVTFDSAYGIIYNKKKVDVPEVIYGDITLIKYEEGTTNVLEGAVIGLYDANGNAIRNAEGNVIQFITNEFGEIKFKAKPGTYKYKELIAPEGYELNDTVYTFTIKEDGTVIFDSANGIIYNKKKEDIPDIPHEPDVPEIYGEVTLTKYEEGTKIALKGATIGIYDSEKNEIKVTTNDNGEVKLKLKPGAYQYQELIAPEGYELDNTIYTFTITKTGKVIFDNDTNGIIYDKKKEDKPDKPDIPEEPNKPDVPDKPKDNVIVPEDNTIIKQPAENLANGRLPQTGETEGMIIITAMFAIVGIYFGIKIRDKQ